MERTMKYRVLFTQWFAGMSAITSTVVEFETEGEADEAISLMEHIINDDDDLPFNIRCYKLYCS
jgi:hypothetical protein